jgi:hypothetical protein
VLGVGGGTTAVILRTEVLSASLSPKFQIREALRFRTESSHMETRPPDPFAAENLQRLRFRLPPPLELLFLGKDYTGIFGKKNFYVID